MSTYRTRQAALFRQLELARATEATDRRFAESLRLLFRPVRTPAQAPSALWQRVMRMKAASDDGPHHVA